MDVTKKNKRPNQKKNRRYTALALTLAILVIVAIIPLNLLADRLNISWDMSSNQMYTMSDTTVEYLNSLETDVTIYVLMTMSDIQSDDSNLALAHLLEGYESFEHVNLVTFDPAAEPELLTSLNPDGKLNLGDGDFLITCEATDMVHHIAGNEMYYYEYELDDDGTKRVTSAIFKGENVLTGAIQVVVGGEQPMVYFLTGHGEKSLDDDFTTLSANLKNNNYGSQSLNLSTADSVPEDAKIVVIAAPQSDITVAELEKLEAFLDEGGNVSLLMSPNEANLRYTNLEALMYEFCLGMNYDRVYETDSSRHISGEPYIVMSNLIESDSVDIASALAENDLYVPYLCNSRSFYQVYGLNYTSLDIGTLMTTNTTAVSEPYGGTSEDPEEIKNQELILAAYSMDSTRADAKMFVIGNADFLTDEYLAKDDGVLYLVPLYLYLGTTSWMYDSFVDAGIPNRDKTFDYMTLNSEAEANRVQIIFGVAPALVALAGVGIWLRRRNS